MRGTVRVAVVDSNGRTEQQRYGKAFSLNVVSPVLRDQLHCRVGCSFEYLQMPPPHRFRTHTCSRYRYTSKLNKIKPLPEACTYSALYARLWLLLLINTKASKGNALYPSCTTALISLRFYAC